MMEGRSFAAEAGVSSLVDGLRVSIYTVTHVHLLWLASELGRIGALGCLISAYPHSRLGKFGGYLKQDCVKTAFGVWPWLAGGRLRCPNWASSGLKVISFLLNDRAASRFAPADCDVVVATSGAYLYTLRRLAERGVKVIVDEPATHVGVREALLKQEYERIGLRYRGEPRLLVRQALKEYGVAHQIQVGSWVAHGDFLESGFQLGRVVVNTYGVDLSRFRFEHRLPSGPRRVLFAGNLRVEKGGHLLLQALSEMDCELWLAGSISEEGKMLIRRFWHGGDRLRLVGMLPSERLAQLMSESDALILPSVQDGFGMVVAQALKCGSPVVVSTRAGASSLVKSGENGYTFTSGDAASLKGAVEAVLKLPTRERSFRLAVSESVGMLGDWWGYTERFLVAAKSLLAVES